MRVRNRRTASWAGVLILGVLVAPVLLHAVFAVLPGLASFVVVSPSMEPTIESGSVVFVVETGDYAPGEVVTYSDGHRVVTHRIVHRTASGYVTKGDANDGEDGAIQEEAILGEVVVSIPIYGHFLRTAASPVGYVLLVAVPSVLLVARELIRLFDAVR